MKVKAPDWSGRTVVCLASGPSLTADDCELVRQSGHVTVVTNTTFRLAPWADVVFGFDAKWWHKYHEEVKATCSGRLMSVAHSVAQYGVETTYCSNWFKGFGNSGSCAVSLGIAGNPDRIIMLGYDCSKDGEKVHWHGDHPKELSNASSMKRWPTQFGLLAAEAKSKGVPVLNASRKTILQCFPRVNLEDVL